MSLDKFFNPQFGEVCNVSGDAYTKGYEAGYADGGVEANALADSLIAKTETEYVNHRITNIGDYGFARHTLLKKIDVPFVTNVGEYGFFDCESLSDITLPSVTRLETAAFHGCRKLLKVDAPMLEFIGNLSFYRTSLAVLIIRQSDKVCVLESIDALQGTNIASKAGRIYVPDELVEQYKVASNWSTYASQIYPISAIKA